MKFKLDILLDISPGCKGMLIPVFKLTGSNLPFAQEMNDSFEVDDMQPYLSAENYEYTLPPDTISTDIGEKGVVAFRSFDENIVVGHINDVMLYRDANRDRFADCPLLDLQLARICAEPLGTIYQKWENAGKAYFEPLHSQSWVRGEYSLFQRNRSIWENIRTPEKASEENFSLKFSHHSFEYLFRWLTENSGHANWDKIWISAFKKNPFDERLYIIAERWLQSRIIENIPFSEIKIMLFCYLEYSHTRENENEDFKELLTDYILDMENYHEMLQPTSFLYLIIRNITRENDRLKFAKLYEWVFERLQGDSRFERTLSDISRYVAATT